MQDILPVANIIKWLKLAFSMSFQYLVFTAIVFFIFYSWKKKDLWYAKIQQRYPANKHILREIAYSVSTLFILAIVIMLVTWANKNGLTRAYKPLDKYGYGYYFFSMVLMMVVHDTYFYWGHRFLHWKPIFKWAHKTHHLSLNPTPFAAYAFHPIEAIFEMGILPVLAFTIPHHISTLTIFALYSLFINVAAHVGYEFLPKGFAKHKLFKWHNTPTHHNLHHRFVKYNFGLYFNFWDRIMKTNHPHYEAEFEALADQRALSKITFEDVSTETIPDEITADTLSGI
jgi:Delta7-sterol 5-desaturase